MSLTLVKVSEDVWLTCVTHALSTEKEEIMGLLLGDIVKSEKGDVTALIWGASPQKRSDRRKDRVETNPEQLAAASAQAEKMTMVTGRTTRVIGWYHSHPHITVLPSHIDVRSQAMYQLLDSGFVGLIFSCFSEDAHKVGRIQIIAFQSVEGEQNYILSPVSLSRKGSVTSLGGHLGNEKLEIENRNANVESSGMDIDLMDASESIQEVIQLSNFETSSAQYTRREIPLEVLPTAMLVTLAFPLASFIELQHILFDEEREAYNQAISQNLSDGGVHPLAFIHHTSTYHASLCKLMEYCLSPAIDVLHDRLKENEIRMGMLSDEARALEREVSDGKKVNAESPQSSLSMEHQPE